MIDAPRDATRDGCFVLNELNKLFGREFVIGFFIPALVLVAASAGVLRAFGILPLWLRIDPADPLKDTTFFAIVTLVTAFFLMAINRNVFRTLEGYWVFNLGNHLNYFQRWRYRRLYSRIAQLDKERNECRKISVEFPRRKERNQLKRKAAQRFPSREDLVLFTSFGNTVRAFEDYPRVMYGFESINGWSRLNAVMPKSYGDVLASTRSITDLWVNLWFVSLFVIAEYFCISVSLAGAFRHWRILLAAVVGALVSSSQARRAVEQWGEWVKAAFDVYLPKLREELGFRKPENIEREREFWKRLSQAFVYRDRLTLDQLDDSRKSYEPDSSHTISEGEESAIMD
jgi:hypothetical protein